MEKIIKELNDLKKAIEEAKNQLAVLQGRKEEAMKMLKDSFGFETVEAATKWIAKAEKELLEEEKKIKTRFEKLKASYAW
jgi:hypothetical protein